MKTLIYLLTIYVVIEIYKLPRDLPKYLKAWESLIKLIIKKLRNP